MNTFISKITEEIVQKYNSKITEKLINNLKIEQNEAKNMLFEVLSEFFNTIKNTKLNVLELMPLMSVLSGDKPDIQALKNISLFNTLQEQLRVFLQKKYGLEESLCKEVIIIMLPVLLEFIKNKYKTNPLELFKIMSS